MPQRLIQSHSYFFFPLILSGLIVIAILPVWWVLGAAAYPIAEWSHSTFYAVIANLIAFSVANLFFRRFERYPQFNAVSFILPILLTVFSISLAVLFVLRLDYSVKILFLGLLITFVYMCVQHVLLNRSKHITLHLVPYGEALDFKSSGHYSFKLMQQPKHTVSNIHGVVADMHGDTLSAEWQKFLCECALRNIPVYNAIQLKETLTGKVNVQHLIANHFGGLSPSGIFFVCKRIIDIIFLVLTAPITIPLMLLLALMIKLDSPGAALFIQPRVGLGGKVFRLVKFRSMHVHVPGAHFTSDEQDARITRVGRVIRKYRLDELPQFWNVLKGEMSLIGPRPESVELAKWYETEVPFFAYRHVVRPGISGWAQVMHGYAAGVEDVKDKLAYDFYYIKHFSLWLDLLIWYKTIKTVFTGYGSR